MPYEDKIINHDVAENLEMLQQTLDNIVVDSFAACGSNYDSKSLEVFQKRGDERHKFANIVNAAIKIARAFRYYKMRKNRKVLLYKSGQPQPRQAKISYYIDSDSSSSQDESEDEEDYLHDYDTGCFIRLPRKAYAAQKIQSCVRGYMVRKNA